jgi:hypothetical protein
MQLGFSSPIARLRVTKLEVILTLARPSHGAICSTSCCMTRDFDQRSRATSIEVPAHQNNQNKTKKKKRTEGENYREEEKN